MPSNPTEPSRFGQFELDVDAGELRRNGRRVKLQPQPFKLLVLLMGRPGRLVSREAIRTELWPEGTFVDFDSAVNFAIKQIRDVLGDSADQPLYIETVPRRGYRFIAPVETGAPAADPPVRGTATAGTTVALQKALWTNIAEIRLAEVDRRRRLRIALVAAVAVFAVLAGYVILFLKT